MSKCIRVLYMSKYYTDYRHIIWSHIHVAAVEFLTRCVASKRSLESRQITTWCVASGPRR